MTSTARAGKSTQDRISRVSIACQRFRAAASRPGLFRACRWAGAGYQWWRVEATVEAFLGRGGTGWARHPLGVGDRECGEHPARGAQRAGYERSGAEAGGERVRVQVGRA